MDVLLPILCLTAGIPIAIIDLRSQRIPNYLSLGALGAVLVAAAILDVHRLPTSLIGACIGFASFWAVNRLTGGKLGMGDAKYSAMIGAALGPGGWFWAVLSGSLVGLLVVSMLLSLRAIDRRARIPFGPFLAAGSAISALFGAALTTWMIGGAAL